MSRLRTSVIALAALASAAAVVPSGAAASTPQLSGSLVGQAAWPNRVLAVWNSSSQPLAPTKLNVTENGHPVSDLSVTPIAEAGKGDLGVIAVVDESSSLTAAQRSIELEALRTLAGARTGSQQLGVIAYTSTPQTVASLTDNPQSLSQSLASAPTTGSGENVLPALSQAIQRLKTSVDAGAVVVIGGGASDQPSGSLTPTAVAAAAHDAGIPVFTLGVQGSTKASRAALARLQSTAGGGYQTVAPGQLDQAVTSAWSWLSHGFVVRYHSLQPHGRSVAVSVKADGVPGAATAGYTSPAAPPAPKPAPHPKPAAPAHTSAPHPFPMPVNTLTKHPPVSLPTAAEVGHSFWHSSGSVVIVSLLAAVLLGLALALVLLPHSRRAVQARVETFIGAPEDDPAAELDDGAPAGGLMKVLAKRPWWPDFLEQIDVGRIKRTPEQLIRLAAIVSLVGAVLGTLVVGTVLVAFPLLLVGPLGLRFGVKHAAKRQRAKFAEQVPPYLQDLSGAMRVGRSLVGGLAAVAETAEEPIRGELDRALADERLGLPLEQTLNTMARRMHSEDIEQVALIASLHRRSGSNAAEALDRVAEGARERADMRRELSAMTGQARITSYVLTALPPLLLVAITFIDPQYAHPLFHSAAGVVVLSICAVMVMAGWRVMKKIIDVEV